MSDVPMKAEFRLLWQVQIIEDREFAPRVSMASGFGNTSDEALEDLRTSLIERKKSATELLNLTTGVEA